MNFLLLKLTKKNIDMSESSAKKEYKLKYTGPQIEHTLDNISSQSLSVESIKLKLGSAKLNTESGNVSDSINELNEKMALNNFKGIVKRNETYYLNNIVFFKNYFYESLIEDNTVVEYTDLKDSTKWLKLNTLNKDYLKIVDDIIPNKSITKHDRTKEYPVAGMVVYNIEDRFKFYVSKAPVPQYIELYDTLYWDEYATGSDMEASDYYNKAEIANLLNKLATKDELTTVYKYKGTVETVNNLPRSNNIVGDTWNVRKDGYNYVWTGTEWDSLAGEISFDDYYDKTEIDSIFDTKLGTATLNHQHDNVINSVNDLWDKYDEFLDPYVMHEVDEIPVGTIIQTGSNLKKNECWLPFGTGETYNDADYPELAKLVKTWGSQYRVSDTEFTLGNYQDKEIYLCQATANYPVGSFVPSRLPNIKGGCGLAIYADNVTEAFYTNGTNHRGIGTAGGDPLIFMDASRCSSIYKDNTERVLTDSIAMKFWIKAKKSMNQVRLANASDFYNKEETYSSEELDTIIENLSNRLDEEDTRIKDEIIGNREDLLTENVDTIVGSINSIVESIEYDSPELPVGSIIQVLNNELPNDRYVWCDGTIYEDREYPLAAKLLKNMGEQYRVEDEPNKFKVPDLTDLNRTLYQASDTKPLGSYISASLPNIKGVLSNPCFEAGGVTRSDNGCFQVVPSGHYGPNGRAHDWDNPYLIFNASRCSSIYQDNARVYTDGLAINYAIKVKPTYMSRSISATEQPIGSIISSISPNPPSADWLPFGTRVKRKDYPLLAHYVPQSWLTEEEWINIPSFNNKSYTLKQAKNVSELGSIDNGGMPNITAEFGYGGWGLFNYGRGAAYTSHHCGNVFSGQGGGASGITIDASRVSSLYKNNQDIVEPGGMNVNYYIKARQSVSNRQEYIGAPITDYKYPKNHIITYDGGLYKSLVNDNTFTSIEDLKDNGKWALIAFDGTEIPAMDKLKLTINHNLLKKNREFVNAEWLIEIGGGGNFLAVRDLTLIDDDGNRWYAKYCNTDKQIHTGARTDQDNVIKAVMTTVETDNTDSDIPDIPYDYQLEEGEVEITIINHGCYSEASGTKSMFKPYNDNKFYSSYSLGGNWEYITIKGQGGIKIREIQFVNGSSTGADFSNKVSVRYMLDGELVYYFNDNNYSNNRRVTCYISDVVYKTAAQEEEGGDPEFLVYTKSQVNDLIAEATKGLQDQIDQLKNVIVNRKDDNTIIYTQAEYDNLTEEEKNNGKIYLIIG